MSIKYKDKLTTKKDYLILCSLYFVRVSAAKLNNTVLLYDNFKGILTIK